jgi:hypothetical protein
MQVPATTSSYRSVLTVHRALAGFATSTTATEDVTFVSGAGAGEPAPSGWSCPDPASNCTVLPILQARVPLPTDWAGRLPIGSTTVNFTLGHVQGAARSAINGVSFAVSSNGGTRYRSLPVSALGGGRYRVALPNAKADAGHGITIRLTATDAAGGKLVETVQNAYLVASK